MTSNEETLKVKLELWMKSNPHLIPDKYIIYVDSSGFGNKIHGYFVSFDTYEYQDVTSFKIRIPGIKIKTSIGPILGPLDTAEILLPISILEEPETKRNNKIENILS